MVPKHVAACFNNGGRSLSVWTFKRDEPDAKTRQPFRCRSWRCQGNDGECATYERRVTWARIKEAVDRDKLSPDGWCFFVLTLDREGTFSGEKRWKDADEAFAALSRMSRKFLERLRHWMGSPIVAKRERRPRMRPAGREWVAVVEAHRSGWPHVNLMLWSPELAEYVERQQAAFSGEWERLGFHKATLPPELMRLARVAKWGTLSTVERVRSSDAVMNYISKLAGEAGQAASELAKLTQLPYNAPQRFRRLRAGKGWLPPRRVNPNITGSVMIRKYDSRDGTPVVLPVHNVKDPLLVQHLPLICYHEQKLWDRERENAVALREALNDASKLPMVPESEATPEKLAELGEASRSAMREAFAEFGTPLMLTVSLPVRVERPPEPEPSATGPPEFEPEPVSQLRLFGELFELPGESFVS